jgi:hypothetical protein
LIRHSPTALRCILTIFDSSLILSHFSPAYFKQTAHSILHSFPQSVRDGQFKVAVLFYSISFQYFKMLGKSKHKYMFENDTHESLILWFDMNFIFRRHSPALKIFRQNCARRT